MRLRANKGFPYPVLSPYSDDYIDSVFNVGIAAEVYAYDLVFNAEVLLKNEELQNLLNSGDISINYHIECAATGYRNVVVANGLNTRFEIPFKDIRDLVEVNTFLVSNCKLENYSNTHFNEDYDQESFEIEAGCILGIAEEIDVRVPKKLTDLTEDDDPFISIIPEKDPSVRTVSVDLEQEKILIKVPEETAMSYQVLQHQSQIKPILHSMFIVPALFQGLIYLKGLNDIEYGEVESLLWVQSLEDVLNNSFKESIKGLREKENWQLYVLAQELVDRPLAPGVQNMMAWTGGQNDED